MPKWWYPNIIAVATVLVGLFIFINTAENSARKLENEFIEHFAGKMVHIKITGSALDRAAAKRNDLLPIIGASEVYLRSSEFDTSHTFFSYPTGFSPFLITSSALTALGMAETFIGFGDRLRGKKVIVSYTPSMFEQSLGWRDYQHNFSKLHLYELIINRDLSFHTKQKLSERLLDFKRIFSNDALLLWSIQNLAKNTWISKPLYYLVYPFVWVERTMLTFEDHRLSEDAIHALRYGNRNIPHTPAEIDWQGLLEKARVMQAENTTSNPYGIDNRVWSHAYYNFHPQLPGSKNVQYKKKLANSDEWDDLRLLLSVLKEEGAKPLILGRPIQGNFYNATGVSAEARRKFYHMFHRVVDPYGFPVIDFREYELDKYFGEDRYPHTGREGWVYVNRAMDDFYHDRLGK